MDENLQKTIENLHRNHMGGHFVQNKEELYALLSALLPQGATVGCGDSVTLEDTGVLQLVREGPYTFYDKYQPGLTKEQKREIYLKNFDADVFLTGVNAVTQGGQLFNIDGNGSRVAPMLYGPRRVVVVAGTNKLVPDVQQAITRARQVAAPLDAKRLCKDTPCTKLGRCVDCRHPQRICNDFVLIAGQFQEGRIQVIFIDGTFGY